MKKVALSLLWLLTVAVSPVLLVIALAIAMLTLISSIIIALAISMLTLISSIIIAAFLLLIGIVMFVISLAVVYTIQFYRWCTRK